MDLMGIHDRYPPCKYDNGEFDIRHQTVIQRTLFEL